MSASWLRAAARMVGGSGGSSRMAPHPSPSIPVQLVTASTPASLACDPPSSVATSPWQAAWQWLFNESTDALLVCDARGSVVAFNRAACELFGVEPPELQGSPIGQWLPREAASEIAAGDSILPPHGMRQLVRGDGQPVQATLRTVPLPPGAGAPGLMLVRVRVVASAASCLVQDLSQFDPLTNLPTRALFRDRLDRAMQRSLRQRRPMALMVLGLDRFRVVNDGMGIKAGDAVLMRTSRVLTSCLRAIDSVSRGNHGLARAEPSTISRLGGDEFTVLVEDIGSAEDAALVARRVLEALAEPFEVAGREVQMSASVGIALFPAEGVDGEELLRQADVAMARVKSHSRGSWCFFSESLDAAVGVRLALEGQLRKALERQEFCLHYQPKADLVTGQITGVEALLRWHCPGHGMVPPDRFIHILEDMGLIVDVGAWVLRTACRQLAQWDDQGLAPVTMAVNLSARQLRHPHLISLVQDSLLESGLEPERLELELTESSVMEDTQGNREVMQAFRRLGVRLAIDDFGTGHSSLSYLRRLDADTLKIDRSFVTELPHDPEDCAIASAIVALARSLQMKVIAEGVETEEQARYLRELGCQEMQGWLLSRALPADAAATLLARREEQLLQRRRGRPRDPDDPITQFMLGGELG